MGIVWARPFWKPMKNLRKSAQDAHEGDLVAIYPGADSDFYYVVDKQPDYLIVTRGKRGRKKYRYDIVSLELEPVS